MKTKVMIMAAALGLFSHGIFANHDGSFTMEASVSEQSKINLNYTKTESTDIRVKLIDETGFVVFDRILSQNNTEIGLKLNVSNLLPGNYTLISKSDNNTTVKTMNLARSENITKIVAIL